MPDWIGKTIGKVRIEKEIARGGMAEVYLGTHLTLDRAVAVKVMHHFVEADPDLQSRFEREAKVVAGLRHPNIVQIFDFDTEDGHPYIVMEYLQGISLAAYLRELHKRNQRMGPAQVARLLMTIGNALDYAHKAGVIHRDIKPGNIILHTKTDEVSYDLPITEQAEPVLTDFGLVRIVQSVTQTVSGAVSGTPAYMSPEQAQGTKVDHRSDIYSLGVVLYEMLAGRIPFDADTSWTMIFKHINEPPTPIPDIRPAVQRVIDRVLAKRPEDRYPYTRAFVADYMDAIGMAAEARTLRFAMAASRPPAASRLTAQAPINGNATQTAANQTPSLAWVPVAFFAGFVILLVALAAILFSRLSPSIQAIGVPTQQPTSLAGSAGPTLHASPIPAVAEADPVGLLRFQDGTALADSVTVSTDSIAPPPQGSSYEVWLIQDDGEQRISLGELDVAQDNNGALSFIDGQGRNLLGTYSAVEVTLEPDDGNPNSSNDVAYAVRLPANGLTHVRHLLYSFGATPNQIGFVDGLDMDTRLLAGLSTQMLAALESGNESDLLLQAEQMLNMVVGTQSAEHRDWNQNGVIDDPGDGYGLLLNGDNLGYIQGTFTHADLAIASPDATSNMLIHGEHVKASANNVDGWTAQLRTQLVAVLENPTSPDRESGIRQAVALANQIRTGLDVNGNEQIEPIPGEGGALTVYEHAYYMADMLILPANSQTPRP